MFSKWIDSKVVEIDKAREFLGDEKTKMNNKSIVADNEAKPQ